jgi:hypothetical protein
VQTRRHWRDFHCLPYRIYVDDPNWVPPLQLERKLHFGQKHNPFFEHAKTSFWLAYRNGEPVGRISAQIDSLHLARYADQTGHFGFIEGIDDPSVFGVLLNTAERWLRENGLTRILGPVSFSMWDQPGLLVEGFDTPPSVMMGHALPYFSRHIETAGYTRIQDLLAYHCTEDSPLPERAERIIARAKREGDIILRNIRTDRKHFDSEIALILDIVNDAWADNWGFVAMTRAEAEHLGAVFRFLLQPNHVAIAEYKGRAAAFALVIPNLNEAIADLRGRLAPFGWAKLLWRLKFAGTRSVRMPLMGVRKALQNSPLGAALALSVIDATISLQAASGIKQGELSWVLDQNYRLKLILQILGARAYKRYRIYEKLLH